MNPFCDEYILHIRTAIAACAAMAVFFQVKNNSQA